MIAALYVQTNGHYYGLPDVDPWDEARDARQYRGPWPVVAHPPCTRWCALAHAVQGRYPHLRVGEDGGCFAAALSCVRRYVGVLEHPAHTKAWGAHDMTKPQAAGGWQRANCGGWVCQVSQGHYGHRAAKATWLYVYGTDDLPELLWGKAECSAVVGFCTNRGNSPKPRLSKREASATPPAFRQILIDIARRCKP